jgi:DNA-binding transcriptional regulator YbjK
MSSRRDDLLDAAIRIVGEHGIRGLTHRAVDAAAGVPAGSTSNYFRTSEALLFAVVDRFAIRERANWEEVAAAVDPTTPRELAHAMAAWIRDAVGPHRTLTLARYAILVEVAQRPELQPPLAAAAERVNAYFTNWMRLIGSADPERDVLIVGDLVVGLVLNQLAYPRPDFDPTPKLTALLETLVAPPRSGRGQPADSGTRGSSTPRRAAAGSVSPAAR